MAVHLRSAVVGLELKGLGQGLIGAIACLSVTSFVIACGTIERPATEDANQGPGDDSSSTGPSNNSGDVTSSDATNSDANSTDASSTDGNSSGASGDGASSSGPHPAGPDGSSSGGSTDASSDAPRPCLRSSECTASDICYFPIPQGCTAIGACLPPPPVGGCRAPIGCGCSGADVPVCAPAGYSPEPLARTTPCPTDASTDARD